MWQLHEIADENSPYNLIYINAQAQLQSEFQNPTVDTRPMMDHIIVGSGGENNCRQKGEAKEMERAPKHVIIHVTPETLK